MFECVYCLISFGRSKKDVRKNRDSARIGRIEEVAAGAELRESVSVCVCIGESALLFASSLCSRGVLGWHWRARVCRRGLKLNTRT